MKHGTTTILPVRIRLNPNDIESIIFLFKQQKSSEAPQILVKTYPGDVTYNSEKQLFEIPFSQSDTWLFEEDQIFYMDSRITLEGGSVPETPIVTLRMHPTLFSPLDIFNIAEDSTNEEAAPIE